ncbi:hypothetical protein FB45DRAFT_425832 [Roridomyces roridus]|uniref:C2H2-type domain-containing protein n=1 Tax=Roridomyces roridus TaxID=1738132 RepID=A0AAD7C5S0_9AGAR|nr:hypothetical protein FB45DRAFT_425832 [Roridomyces roridus]
MYQNIENEEEAAAMLEAFSRIQEVACMWDACEGVLNSFENLITHLHKVHAQETNEHFTCMWDLCGETFADYKQLGMHAETHVLATIHCARLDCNETFTAPAELVAHNIGHEKTELKPSARPTIPLEPPVHPELPATVPEWALFAPGIAMPSIPQERHEELGPWVLRHIYAPVNVRAKRYNAALHPGDQRDCAGDFEFLQTRARAKHYSNLPSYPAKVREMADLNSKEVSELIASGDLVLWPTDQGEGNKEVEVVDTDEDELAVAGMLIG